MYSNTLEREVHPDEAFITNTRVRRYDPDAPDAILLADRTGLSKYKKLLCELADDHDYDGMFVPKWLTNELEELRVLLK